MATANKHPQVNLLQVNTRFPSDVPGDVFIDLDLAKLTLNDMGEIQNCSHTCEQVFGYRQDELAGRHISTLLPELGDTELVQEGRINSRLAFLCHCAYSFQARRRDGNCFTSELFINRLGNQNVLVLVRSLQYENRSRRQHRHGNSSTW